MNLIANSTLLIYAGLLGVLVFVSFASFALSTETSWQGSMFCKYAPKIEIVTTGVIATKWAVRAVVWLN